MDTSVSQQVRVSFLERLVQDQGFREALLRGPIGEAVQGALGGDEQKLMLAAGLRTVTTQDRFDDRAVLRCCAAY